MPSSFRHGNSVLRKCILKIPITTLTFFFQLMKNFTWNKKYSRSFSTLNVADCPWFNKMPTIMHFRVAYEPKNYQFCSVDYQSNKTRTNQRNFRALGTLYTETKTVKMAWRQKNQNKILFTTLSNRYNIFLIVWHLRSKLRRRVIQTHFSHFFFYIELDGVLERKLLKTNVIIFFQITIGINQIKKTQ